MIPTVYRFSCSTTPMQPTRRPRKIQDLPGNQQPNRRRCQSLNRIVSSPKSYSGIYSSPLLLMKTISESSKSFSNGVGTQACGEVQIGQHGRIRAGSYPAYFVGTIAVPTSPSCSLAISILP